MLVGALLHLGAPFKPVREALAHLDGVRLSHRLVTRGGLRAKKFTVRRPARDRHRGLGAVLRLVRAANLASPARRHAEAVFSRLAEAEARVHGIALEKVHFHEVGALDAVCDIVAGAVCLGELGIDMLFSRPLPLGRGTVQAAHGRLPLPAPATLELLCGRPVFESGMSGELVTPTGAAMVAAWCETGPAPALVPQAIGYGAGDRDPEGYANVCRVILGEAAGKHGPLLELVCDLDDATPQVLGHLMGRLLEAGALDAVLQPLVMKKGRPGTRVCVLAGLEQAPVLEELLFVEGTTLGVRRRAVERTELPRRRVSVSTDYGTVRVKLGEIGGRVVHIAPEYEDCRARAAEAGVALGEVIRQAMARWGG